MHGINGEPVGCITPYMKTAPVSKGSNRVSFLGKRKHLVTETLNLSHLEHLADKYWSTLTLKSHSAFDADVIENVYTSDLSGDNEIVGRKKTFLEFGQYLENYLWPNFEADKASKAYVLSIVFMVNEKFRESVPAWFTFQQKPEQFGEFFRLVMMWSLKTSDANINLDEQTALLIFLNHCFLSMEVELVRCQIQRLVSLSMWFSLLPSRREAELKSNPKWKKYWKAIEKRDTKMDETSLKNVQFERTFMKNMLDKFFFTLKATEFKQLPDYIYRFLLLVIDLQSCLPTRRFFNTVLDDEAFVVRCQLSSAFTNDHLFAQLLEQIRFYARFEISDVTGESLDSAATMKVHYDRVTSLQLTVFSHFPDVPTLRNFALAPVATIDDAKELSKCFSTLDKKTLYSIAQLLCLVPSNPDAEQKKKYFSKSFLLELLIWRHERIDPQLQKLNEMPLYPTEQIVWDENVVPGEFYNGESILALPRLNLQFLTSHDYLLRNFRLFQLESTYEVRGDVEDVVSRMRPYIVEDDSVVFGGWARMALPVSSFSIVEVAKPDIGEKQPSRVRADVGVNLSVRENIRQEWEGLRKHDVCFLICVQPPRVSPPDTTDFVQAIGLRYIRGCEVEGMLDENGRVIEEGLEAKPNLPGEARTFRVKLDCNQYQIDMDQASQGQEDVYDNFNIFMRRKPKENNFKAVLETIRELMNTHCVVPDFLHDIILGYGDPASAHYTKMPQNCNDEEFNFNDTFLDLDHLRHSFPQYPVIETSGCTNPPFKITFPSQQSFPLRVQSYVPIKRGPYPVNTPRVNSVRFTPTQIEAIRSGLSPGLTMVVGPPGTGKTDVAVQIISNIYHNFPQQRTLIVTHSNQALNQLFEKIILLDVDERHLLRLGHGEEGLDTEKDFSRYGRVNYVLEKRMQLLESVGKLKDSLINGVIGGDVAYTCETAGYFFLYEVVSRWEVFLSKVHKIPHDKSSVARLFPFTNYFDSAPQPLFKQVLFEEDLETANSCWRYIENIFDQLEEFRAFELLRNGVDRTRYLCVKEAKIIAMTCTHAALKRKELVQIGFKYDNILMEEAAQILEIETFIPLLLQNPQDGRNRLKRWIMIGDHHQLPPVIKNMAFQKFSNMEQSLFTRLVRLGVPTVDLDAQGRARPSICSLYNWRYKCLGNLGHVLTLPEYVNANGGFSFDYQIINVPDFNGVGESQPSPFFYQNLAEAEYVVAVFTYMRLLGYPANKISILTTYNGQKHLIRDVINSRCGSNQLIGHPARVTTVDKYQGQQNDYILLSLVRSLHVGHLRDVRRLIVAMSRARLGLYIFGRVNLFRNCQELQPTFNLLAKRPLELHLCPNEVYGTKRPSNVNAPNPIVISSMIHMTKFVYDFYLQKMQALSELAKAGKAAAEASLSRHQEDLHNVSESDSNVAVSEEEKKDSEEEMMEIVNEV